VPLSPALRRVKEALIDANRFEEAARLRDHERELQRLVAEIEADLARLAPEVGLTLSRSVRADRWEYDVRKLAGTSDSWPQQLTRWRKEGWELLAVVPEEAERRAILERRVWDDD
jgi:hypothetical protein